MFGKQWDALKSEDGGTQPSSGKVPILWDDETVVWDSLAILEYLADKVGRDRFWPKDAVARGMARSMVAEMHSSYHALRGECLMNMRKRFDGFTPSEACVAGHPAHSRPVGGGARSRFGSGGPVPVRHFRRGGCLLPPCRVTLHQLPDRRARFRRRLYAGGVGA